MLLSILLAAAPAWAVSASSTTTTTNAPGTTTTTLFVPTDVSAGGDFEGGFPAGSFDSYAFELAEPRVLVAETSNGFGGCPGDTFVELRRPGGPGTCTAYGDELPCIAYDDDSGAALCSRLVEYLPAPGSYEIRVSRYGGARLLRYFLHVEFVQIECGNGELELTEQCDDGNTAAGDCCSPSCRQDSAGTACDDGLFCNGSDSCNAGGACSDHAGDPCPGPDADPDCAESCDETEDACSGHDAAGSSCDDGVFCNGADTCVDGACSDHAGNPCPGPDADADCSEACNEAAGACSAADPDQSACDDGQFCNGTDTCSAGECTAHAGNPCSGPDGDHDCAESCNEAGDACTAADDDGSACNDGLFCNGADTCQAGSCSQHVSAQCPGADGDANCAESCSDSAQGCSGFDPPGSPCDDGLFCNGADTCSNGSCSVHAGNPCAAPDGDGNCSESCNELSGACNGPDAAGSSCDDGDPCTPADKCDGSGKCAGGAAIDCDDGNPCTADSCIAAPSGCVHASIPDCPATTTTTTTLATTTTTTLATFLCGDVTGDGLVRASDALGVLKAAVGGTQCAGRTCSCDASGNGALTATDALMVLKFAVGAPVQLMCPC